MVCSTIILAAGASKRMGKAKQLLPFRGKPLVWQAAKTATDLKAGPVWVVVPVENEGVKEGLKGMEVELISNPNAGEGIASSIVCGIRQIRKEGVDPDAVLIMVADQPYVSLSLLEKLWQTMQKETCAIVACTYGDSIGTPAIFSAGLLQELEQLTGDSGAKKIIQSHLNQVRTIPFEKGIIDIDTPEDYEQLLKENNEKHSN